MWKSAAAWTGGGGVDTGPGDAVKYQKIVGDAVHRKVRERT